MQKNEPEVQLFSKRLLNPFRGFQQLVHTPGGRAISHNGVEWQIEILSDWPSDTWGGPSKPGGEKILIKFGRWTHAGGLRQIPANPLLDLTKMRAESDRLVALLKSNSHLVPFPALDRFECWLLDDKYRQPLALLASSVHPPAREERVHLQLSSTRERNPPPFKMESLAQLIRQRASQYKQCWYARNPQGRATRVQDAECDENGAESPDTSCLPPLILNTDWPDPAAQRMVEAYHHWLAPHLLGLQHLSDRMRSNLEVEASGQPGLIAEYWHLYPKIIDRRSIDTARVKARLQDH